MKIMYNFVSSKLTRGRNDVAPKGWHFIMSLHTNYANAAPRPVVETPGRFFSCKTLTARSAAFFMSKSYTLC